MKNAGFLKIIVVLGVVASVAMAADLFKDDFSNCAASSDKWTVYPPVPDSCIATCGSGIYKLQNDQKGNVLLSVAAIPVKPSTLTVSVTIARTNDSISAGFMICLKTTPAFSGYAVQLNPRQSLSVYKYSNGSGALISFNTSTFLRSGNASNTIMVSKVGNKLYLYCNGHPLDPVTDASNPLADGDFSLLVPNGRSATFDDVLVTDQATLPVVPRCIVDNFNDNSTFGWGDFGNLAVVQEINSQYLSINTMNPGAWVFHYWDLKVDTFVSKTVLSFRKGKPGSIYGFFLQGPAESGKRVPTARFAINALKQYAAGDTLMFGPTSPFIKGPPYINGTDTTYKWDTLEVIKTKGSPYKMYVNSVFLDSLPEAKVSFPITSVGIFCDDSLSVYVDSFYVKPDNGACLSIVKVAKKPALIQRATFSPNENVCLFNPLGRKVYALEYYSSNPRSSRTRAPGYYISSNGRSGIVVKKR